MPLDTQSNLPNALDALQALVRRPTRPTVSVPRPVKDEVPRSQPVDIPRRISQAEKNESKKSDEKLKKEARVERKKSLKEDEQVQVSRVEAPKRVSVSSAGPVPAPLMELPMLSRLNIDHILSPPKENNGRAVDHESITKYKPQNYSISRENESVNYTLKDFMLIRDIGSGGCAKVYQVKRMDDGKVLALKTMRLDVLVQREQVYQIDLGRTCQE